MPNYDFRSDLETAKQTEQEIAMGLEKNYGVKAIDEMSVTSKWDRSFRTKSGNTIAIEMKEDFMWEKTGNTVIEFESRGKPSGIRVTEADWFIYRLRGSPHKHYIFKTTRLKKLIDEKKYERIVVGGDEGSETKMYLFGLDVLLPWGKELDLSI